MFQLSGFYCRTIGGPSKTHPQSQGLQKAFEGCYRRRPYFEGVFLRTAYSYPMTETTQGFQPRPRNVALFRAFWSPLDGIWGILKGSWGCWDPLA